MSTYDDTVRAITTEILGTYNGTVRARIMTLLDTYNDTVRALMMTILGTYNGTIEHIYWLVLNTYDGTVRIQIMVIFGTYSGTVRALTMKFYWHLWWCSTSTYYDTSWALVEAWCEHLSLYCVSSCYMTFCELLWCHYMSAHGRTVWVSTITLYNQLP